MTLSGGRSVWEMVSTSKPLVPCWEGTARREGGRGGGVRQWLSPGGGPKGRWEVRQQSARRARGNGWLSLPSAQDPLQHPCTHTGAYYSCTLSLTCTTHTHKNTLDTTLFTLIMLKRAHYKVLPIISFFFFLFHKNIIIVMKGIIA